MTKPLPRRVFLLTLATTGAALTTRASAQAHVDEKDPQAVALGYVADAKRVDVKKVVPKYARARSALLRALPGQATDKAAGCIVCRQEGGGTGW